MMGTTHALMGLLIGASAYFIDPGLMITAGIAGFIGGLLPDFDMIFQHRKTLHFPAYYTILAAAFLPVALIFPTQPTVFAFYLLASAAIHCYLDVFGGGLEERPWEGKSDKTVYHHMKGEWLEKRRGVRYDGAPEDFLLGLVFGAAGYLIYTGWIRELIIVSVIVSLVYSLLRKKIVDWAPDWLKEIF